MQLFCFHQVVPRLLVLLNVSAAHILDPIRSLIDVHTICLYDKMRDVGSPDFSRRHFQMHFSSRQRVSQANSVVEIWHKNASLVQMKKTFPTN